MYKFRQPYIASHKPAYLHTHRKLSKIYKKQVSNKLNIHPTSGLTQREKKLAFSLVVKSFGVKFTC